MVFDLTVRDPLERIQTFWSAAAQNTDPANAAWDTPLQPYITPVSASVLTPSTCIATYILTVDSKLCNRSGNLHGGAAATIFDLLTSISIAPLAKEGRFTYAGVSRTLNCTYLRPVPLGMKALVTCEVIAVSGRLAHIRAWMKECDESGKENGEVLVVCEHGKVNTDAKL